MDRQSLRRGGAGAGGVQEFCHVGSRQPEVAGGALFLMELLEDTPAHYADQAAPEAVDDRLRRVMRALEAELSGGAATVPGPEDREQSTATANMLMSDDDDNDGGLEDMLSEFDGGLATEAPSLAAAAVPFEYWDEAPPLMGDDGMGGWFVDGVGFVAGYELREPCYYTSYGEASGVEQVYSPLCLWE